MKLYSIYTDETKNLKDIFVKSIKDNWKINISYWGKMGEGGGDFGTPEYTNLIRKRIGYLIDIIKKTGEISLYGRI